MPEFIIFSFVAYLLFLKGFAKESLNAFNKILEKSIKSPRATYGRSGALLKLAELQSSNTLLQQGIQVLEVLLSNPDTPDALLLKSGLILADKQRFRGKNSFTGMILFQKKNKKTKISRIVYCTF